MAVTLRVHAHVGVASMSAMALGFRVHMRGSCARIGANPWVRVLTLVRVDALHGRVLIRGWRRNVTEVLAVAVSLLDDVDPNGDELRPPAAPPCHSARRH
jgi:hypothetical protein